MTNVYVTGIGIISAIGIGVDATLQNLRTAHSGVSEINILPTTHHQFPTGEVKLTNRELADYLQLADDNVARRLRTVLLGLIAVKEAVSMAQLTPELLREAAFINGTTVGGMDNTEKCFQLIADSNGLNPVAKDLKFNDCGCTTELIADNIGDFKYASTISTACSSASNAIINGADLIKAGLTDIAIAGGTEALSLFHLNGFKSLMILDDEVCKPFDVNRKGINLGEGAAYLILESEKSVKSRNIKPLVKLSGYGNACDAFHQTASSENGEGAFRCMQEAITMSGLKASDVSYINAHGTGTQNNDSSELAAMQRIWSNTPPPFSSTKPLTGHTTSAAGGIEAVVSILSILHSFVPSAGTLTTPINKFYCPAEKVRNCDEVKNVLSNSFGFGGNDSSLIFSKLDSCAQ